MGAFRAVEATYGLGMPGINRRTGSTGQIGAFPPTAEYLAAIYVLEQQGGAVVQARLAERVGHTAPTVSGMVHRLEEAGYVTGAGHGLRLSDPGRELAEKVLRKHCLAARLLADVIGLPWHLVHDEATRWEHVISDEVADRLVQVLGHPTTCPHGCPVPGLCVRVPLASVLGGAKTGQRVRLLQVVDPGGLETTTLAYLEDNHFLPGTEATVSARGPDGSLVLEVGDHTVVMGAALAGRLLVSPPD